jgi:hypothetical protein
MRQDQLGSLEQAMDNYLLTKKRIVKTLKRCWERMDLIVPDDKTDIVADMVISGLASEAPPLVLCTPDEVR